MLFSVRLCRRGKLSDFLSLHENTAGGNDELRVKENELEKEMEKVKLSSNDAGGETPPPSPERQATIEAPFEDIFTCFLSCSASMSFSLLWLHSRFWILLYAWTVSEKEGRV